MKWPNTTLKLTRSNRFFRVTHAITQVELKKCTKRIEWAISSSTHVSTVAKYSASILASFITWTLTPTSGSLSVISVRKNSILHNMSLRTNVKSTEIKRRYFAKLTFIIMPDTQTLPYSCWSTPASCVECDSNTRTTCSITKRDIQPMKIRKTKIFHRCLKTVLYFGIFTDCLTVASTAKSTLWHVPNNWPIVIQFMPAKGISSVICAARRWRRYCRWKITSSFTVA